MKLQDKILVKVTQEDADKAKPYNQHCGCLGYQALHRMFPNSSVKVWWTAFHLDDEYYTFPVSANNEIYDSYNDFGENIKSTFKPFEFTATRSG